MLKMIDRITGHKPEVQAPLFSEAHVSEARRAEAWLKDRLAKARGLADGDMMSEVVMITPALAEVILNTCNRGNRSLKPARFTYAKKMAAGQWKLTSQGLSFSREGILNNGQNRLSAVVIAARPVRMMVTFGEDREAFDVLDTGAIRGGSDALHISGYKNTALLASSARLLSLIESGDFSAQARVQNDDIINIVKQHPRLEDMTTSGMRMFNRLRCSASATTAAFYLISEHSPHTRRLSHFIDKLATGTDLAGRDPILCLREGLMKRELGRPRQNGLTASVHAAAAIIKAWNKHVHGKNTTMAGIRWTLADPFPIVE